MIIIEISTQIKGKCSERLLLHPAVDVKGTCLPV